MTPGADRLRQTLRGDRGVSHVVGFTLLLGIVLMGSVLVLVLGIGLLESLEDDSEAEITHSAIDTTEHSIETTASTDQTTSIPIDNYRPDGTVHIAWYNASAGATKHDAVEAGNETVEIDPLGALVDESDDMTVILQGGGSWVDRNGEYRVNSEPDIGYEDESLQLRLLTLTEDEVQQSEGTAQPNPDSDLSERLEEASENATRDGYNDMALVIESEYHDGWSEFLTSEFDNRENFTVNSGETSPVVGTGSDETVEVIMENVTDSSADFWIKEDHGVVSGEDGENKHVGTDDLEFKATLENVGEVEEEQDVELDIIGGPEITEPIELSSGQEENVTFTLADPHDHLQQGEEYEYQIYTDQDELEQPGSFYFSPEPEPYLDIDVPRVDGMDASDEDDPVEFSGDNATVEIDITNIGGANLSDGGPNAGELELSLEVDGVSDDDPYDLEGTTNPEVSERTVGETGTATWTLERDQLHEGDHEFTVSAVNGNEATGYFTVDDGINVEDSMVIVDAGTEVTVRIIGSELSSYRSYYGENNWAPAFVDVYTQRVDDDGNPIEDPVRHGQGDGVSWADSNVNRHELRDDILEYQFVPEERVSFMLQATSYGGCGDRYYNYQRDQWEWDGWVSQETKDGITYFDCPTGDEDNQLVELTADAGTEESNVRVLNESRNALPEIDPGVEPQYSVDEILEREEVGIGVSEDPDGSGTLDLEDDEAVFLFEITHHPEQYNTNPELDENTEWTNERYWQEAFDGEHSDPNFNDMLAHIEFDRQSTALQVDFEPGSGDRIDFGPGDESHREQGNITESDIDVGTDEIIIG
ncbi:hypothetical protein [Natrialba sp. INN-245]|uniref:COG1470 family protein n=1 Tax=Natrialba sp. INN-245 TaxID=2690967 RepID=UPI0013125D1D|nr:hypothetical protein [Natrialba sp. INN-245]MWV39186.1 hypothetical protein [Natrialba sp. INN-245]